MDDLEALHMELGIELERRRRWDRVVAAWLLATKPDTLQEPAGGPPAADAPGPADRTSEPDIAHEAPAGADGDAISSRRPPKRANRGAPATCPHCREVFTVKNPKQRFCSATCRMRAENARRKERATRPAAQPEPARPQRQPDLEPEPVADFQRPSFVPDQRRPDGHGSDPTALAPPSLGIAGL